MARNRALRLAALTFSNLLLPIAVLVFASGFFPYKPFLTGLATFEDVQEPGSANVAQPEANFDRVVFMVVDALRSDFVYGYNSGFAFTQR
jgi:ethanolaminephosphotransferase